MMRTRLLAAPLLAALAVPATGQAQEPIRPKTERPHVSVGTYLHDGVALSRLQARVVRRGHLLHARVFITARSEIARTVRLDVARCHGAIPHAICPAAHPLLLRLRPAAVTRFVRDVTLRQPAANPDQIQVAVVKPQRVTPGFPDYGVLTLRGTAWRGPVAGRTFGIFLRPTGGLTVQRATLDLAGVAADQVRANWNWDGFARQPLTATTAFPCGGAGRCRTQTNDIGTAPQRIAARWFIARPPGSSVFSMNVVAPDGSMPLQITLPWPDPARAG